VEPGCEAADEYRALARAIDNNKMFVIPQPIGIEELEKIMIEFGYWLNERNLK